ncbi:MAG: P-loop NTPase fold protein, partial [Verrucomicrobiota bacterium]
MANIDPTAILAGIFERLDRFDFRADLGNLKHVLVPLYEQADYDAIETVGNEPESKSNSVRPKKMENDIPSGEDQLEIESEIMAIADSIALKELSPPLVVGILGGWGTGKSFALHLLEKRLTALRTWDLTDEKIHESFPFVGHLYLVKFDAWTYAKEDLWASLMHTILREINTQLEFERVAGAERIRKGIDIWTILRNLTAMESEALRGEAGEQILEGFKSWKASDNLTETLRDLLRNQREAEWKHLEKAEEKLEARREEYDALLANYSEEEHALTRIAEGEAIQLAIAAQTAEIERLLDTKRQDLTEVSAQILTDVEIEFNERAKVAAWSPIKDRLKLAFQGTIEDVLPDDLKAAPDSISGLFEDLKEFQASKSLTPHHIFYWLIALGLIPVATILVTQITSGDQWKSWIAVATGAASSIATIITSFRSKSKKVLDRLKQEQEAYDAALAKQVAILQEEKDSELERRRLKEEAPLREALAKAEAQRDEEIERVRFNQNLAYRRQREELETQFETDKRKFEADIATLTEEINERVRLIGWNPSNKTLSEVIHDRIAEGGYEEHLGIVHRVQEDIAQISDALLSYQKPDSVTDAEAKPDLFPRGEPRIVLVVDDLDRCPPPQVVQILEAAQLLVRTRLFVVVIGMDVRYVSRALEKEYTGVLVPDGTPSGLDY